MGCAVKSTSRRWPNGIVPYVIHPEVTGVQAIYDAMNYWESQTNVRFVRKYVQADYLEFILDTSAVGYAYSEDTGRIGGRQVLACNDSFDTRTYMHEIGHVLGLNHEQKRSDRDEFVKIHFDNVQHGNASQFEKETDSMNSDNYDYRSIMHYGATAFAKDRSKPVIEPLDPAVPPGDLGNTSVPTATDTAMVNSMYPKKGVVRRSSSQNGAGAVSEIASLATGSRIITAVRAGNNNLKMILWNTDSLGGVQRLSPSDDPNSAGAATSISLTQAGNNFVTAMRNGSGNIFLISWQFAANGQLTRKNDSASLAGEASIIKVIGLSTTRILTACRDGSGNLKLILWSVDSDGRFARLSDSGSQAGEVSEISLLKLRSSNTEHIVCTSVRAGNGTVKVITWAVSTTANTITRRGDSGSQIGEGTQIKSAVSQFGHLVISCRSGSGNLVLISLSVSAAAREINRIADSHSMAGEISTNSIIARSYGVLSGVRDGSGNLRLIKWQINTAGQFTRLGDSTAQAGEAGLISLTTFVSNPGAPICSAVRDGSGNLLLITWDDDSRTGELQR
jgi:hypothetical protein